MWHPLLSRKFLDLFCFRREIKIRHLSKILKIITIFQFILTRRLPIDIVFVGALKSHRTSKMSNILVTPIEEGSEAGKNSRGDGHHIRPVSIKMLEIAEKLDTLNQECQILNVENKGKPYTNIAYFT